MYRLIANQHTFNGRVLNKADHNKILHILDDRIRQSATDADPFSVALNAVTEVYVLAERNGWNRDNAERLATYAALTYGALLNDAATDVRIGR